MTKKTVSQETGGERGVTYNTQAIHIGTHYDGSEEWHELRAGGIGGSEIGTILGLNRWDSPYSLWAKKTGKIERTPQNDAMEWGHRLEPVILDKFEDNHPDLIVHRDMGTWHHPERPWQRSNPDALFEDSEGNFGIIEVKTAMYEEDWKDGIPRQYEAQVQWYLDTFGYSKAYIVALFHGNKYGEWEVTASPLQQSVLVEAAEQFRPYLIEDKAPDYDGSTATLEVIRALHPQIDNEAEVELGDLGVHYFLALADLDTAEAHANEMKSRVLDAMGSAKTGLIHDEPMVTRQARGNGTPFLVNKRGAKK